MWLLASISAVALLAPVDNGQAAVDRAKSLLTAFGVPGPIRLQMVEELNGPGTSPWKVEVVARNGASYTMYLSREGTSTILQRAYAGHGGAKQANVRETRYENIVRRWMAKVGTKEPVRLESVTIGEDGVGHAWFAILRNGYPFVSHGRHGYSFEFLTPKAEFLSYRATENPPPVDPRPPVIKDSNSALAAFKNLWDTQIAPRAAKERHWRVWYDHMQTPELGYWLPKGGKTAILVWLFHYWSNRDVGYAIQGGDSGMLMDAITGQTISTDVVP